MNQCVSLMFRLHNISDCLLISLFANYCCQHRQTNSQFHLSSYGFGSNKGHQKMNRVDGTWSETSLVDEIGIKDKFVCISVFRDGVDGVLEFWDVACGSLIYFGLLSRSRALVLAFFYHHFCLHDQNKLLSHRQWLSLPIIFHHSPT